MVLPQDMSQSEALRTEEMPVPMEVDVSHKT